MSHKEHSDLPDICLYVLELVQVVPRVEVLSGDEIARADRYPPGRRNAFVRSRTALRELLGRLLGIAPESLPLVIENGKPRLDTNSDLRFSLAHSGDLAVVAVAYGMDVGADIEAVRDDVAPKKLSAAFFDPFEIDALSGGADFFELWTRREASVKLSHNGSARYFWTGRPAPMYVVSVAAEQKFRLEVVHA
jgi:4'-phosphopantetheinyl transferase